MLILMLISYYDNADDACHQISYDARLVGIWMGQIGAKMGKRGDRKKNFFGKVPLWYKTFL